MSETYTDGNSVKAGRRETRGNGGARLGVNHCAFRLVSHRREEFMVPISFESSLKGAVEDPGKRGGSDAAINLMVLFHMLRSCCFLLRRGRDLE